MLDLDAGGGGIFRGWSLFQENVRGSLFVSSELLNMLLQVTPGRWLRGNFSGEGVHPCRSSGENGEFVRQLQLTKMLLYVTHGRWWRGELSGGFLREGFFIRYFGV